MDTLYAWLLKIVILAKAAGITMGLGSAGIIVGLALIMWFIQSRSKKDANSR